MIHVRKIDWINPDAVKRVKVRPGQIYEFTEDMICRNGDVHPKGSRLHVHDSTIETPYNEVGPNGVNWICRTKLGITIWSTLEHCIERRVLKELTSMVFN